MKPTIFDYCLSRYVSDDKLRPGMRTPFEQNNFCLATNTFNIISIPKEHCGLSYKNNTEFPDALSIISDFEFDSEITLKVEDIVSEFFKGKFNWTKENEECELCDGIGEIECQCCGNSGKCNSCNGSGYSEKTTPFSELRYCTDEEYFVIANRGISPNHINNLMQTAYFLKAEEIIVRFKKDDVKKLICQIGDVKILTTTKAIQPHQRIKT